MLQKNLNFVSLAKKTGIKKSTLHLHLTTKDVFEEPRKIAKALGVNLKDLI